MNAKSIFEQINFLSSGNEPILMTHGNKTSFCHRHILAKWFEEELGVIVEEFKIGNVSRSDGYMKKITQKVFLKMNKLTLVFLINFSVMQ